MRLTIEGCLSSYLETLGNDLAVMRAGLELRTDPERAMHLMNAYLEESRRASTRLMEVREMLLTYRSEPEGDVIQRHALKMVLAYRDGIAKSLGLPAERVGEWAMRGMGALGEVAA